jgi:hypothetical protein
MLVHKFSPDATIKQMGCDDADHNSMRRGRAAAPRMAAQSQQPGRERPGLPGLAASLLLTSEDMPTLGGDDRVRGVADHEEKPVAF